MFGGYRWFGGICTVVTAEKHEVMTQSRQKSGGIGAYALEYWLIVGGTLVVAAIARHTIRRISQPAGRGILAAMCAFAAATATLFWLLHIVIT